MEFSFKLDPDPSSFTCLEIIHLVSCMTQAPECFERFSPTALPACLLNANIKPLKRSCPVWSGDKEYVHVDRMRFILETEQDRTKVCLMMLLESSLDTLDTFDLCLCV